MAEIGSDFSQGSKDEAAIQHAGMGDLQLGSGDGFVVVEEDVEINEARAFGEGFLAAHGGFDGVELLQEIERGQNSLRFEGGVEEPGLFEIINGLGFVDAGNFQDADAGIFEKTNGFAKVVIAIADVGSQRDVDGGHAELPGVPLESLRSYFTPKRRPSMPTMDCASGNFKARATAKKMRP